MAVYRDWMGTLLCRYKMCRFVWLMQILQIPTLASQSSYDDSSWRQTAFSQSVALMSLLCPSVHSEGWLSLVCVGDHSTIRPSQAFPSLISCLYTACATMPSQRGQYITTETSAVKTLVLTKLRFYWRAPSFFCKSVWAVYWLTGGNGKMSAFKVCLLVWYLYAFKQGRAISTCCQQSIYDFSLFWLSISGSQISRYFKLSKFRTLLCRLLIYTCKIFKVII